MFIQKNNFIFKQAFYNVDNSLQVNFIYFILSNKYMYMYTAFFLFLPPLKLIVLKVKHYGRLFSRVRSHMLVLCFLESNFPWKDKSIWDSLKFCESMTRSPSLAIYTNVTYMQFFCSSSSECCVFFFHEKQAERLELTSLFLYLLTLRKRLRIW